jgi:hypothetical protein
MKIEHGHNLLPDVVKRPWGYYDLFSNNVRCTTKILYVRRGECLSMQYHFKRDQLYFILDNKFVVEYTDKSMFDLGDMDPDEFLKKNMIYDLGFSGSSYYFKRGHVHRVKYIGDKAIGRILDVAFGVNDEEDIIRIKDEYGRQS